MEFVRKLVYTIFHLSPENLNNFLGYVGPGKLYVILFLIIFAETGLVVTPFLPGDSLLFALGAVGSQEGSPINLPLITVLLIVAAVLGDAANYWIGYRVGPAIFRKGEEVGEVPAAGRGGIEYEAAVARQSLVARALNRKHLLRAQEFYEKYGGKTIILARFVPIVRTFAPFVAGVGKMNYLRFALFNVVGGIAWVLICVLAGVFFGRIEFVRRRFEVVIVAIVVISVLPMVVEFLRARQARRRGFVVTGTPVVGENAERV
jgi:membrane-associated protein